jgi:hypothetical protein
MYQDSKFRDGARKGIEEIASRARALASRCAESGTPASRTVEIVYSNIERASRSEGKRAKGVKKATFSTSSGMKKTGKGPNKARAAQDSFARAADSITRFRKMHAAVSHRASKCTNRANRKRLKKALSLSARVYSDGEILRAIEILKSV